MLRGLDLEPFARELFTLQTGIKVFPKIVVKDWLMASLDGVSDCNKLVVEIKCPSAKDHALSMSGKVPDHYFPQLQHQMYVCDVDQIFYYSFDGFDGVNVVVYRDNAYIEKMLIQEWNFYQCIINKKQPDDLEEFKLRDDEEWKNLAQEWIKINQEIKTLEKKEQEIRKKLIDSTGKLNCKGAGISLSLIQKKGTVDYTKIPQLQTIDLDMYRGQPTTYWKINIL
jgi:hypothetical protein